jgi:CPA1 family monovalent cation:H+ antiporter
VQLFESTLLLLGIAVVLLQIARRLRLPYPSLLALTGGCVALLPFAPYLNIDPRLALALFVAPAVLDTAFDLPPRELLRLWLPLVSLAVVLVMLTAVAVAWVGVHFAGLPVAAAFALGAIVAPPDAAAAAAVLREFNLPRRTVALLQGESLLNDAVALLAFGLAVTAATSQGGESSALLPRLLIAVPGGAALGVGLGAAGMKIFPKLAGTLSSILAQFLLTYGAWILADRLGLSPIMCVVALAAVASRVTASRSTAQDRVNSNAVWATVVFVLNVLAFLLMGLQARSILDQLHGPELHHALFFAVLVLATVIVVRFAYVLTYGAVWRRFHDFFEAHVFSAPIPKFNIGVLVSWCGMRGLVTLATAFALPGDFPGRQVIVLSAFIVVLGTLILQGFTIRPLIALLKIEPDDSLDEDVAEVRKAMLEAVLAELADASGESAAAVRAEFSAAKGAVVDRSRPVTEYDTLRRRALKIQRDVLFECRREGRILDDAYHILEDELDRAELHSASLESTWLQG